jgi:hypothetical protein
MVSSRLKEAVMQNVLVSPPARKSTLALMRADRLTRVCQAVAEALDAVNPAGFRQLPAERKQWAIAGIASELLAGAPALAGARAAVPASLPEATPRQITAVAWRLVFDLEGGPGRDPSPGAAAESKVPITRSSEQPGAMIPGRRLHREEGCRAPRGRPAGGERERSHRLPGVPPSH